MKKRFLAGFLCLVMLTSMIAGITLSTIETLASDDLTNETYFEKLSGVTDFEEGTAGNIILGWWASRADVPDVYGQDADENLYAKVYSVDGEAAAGDDVYIYPTGKGGSGVTLSGKKDYVYEFKFKANNPNGTTLKPKISFGAALSNSADSTQVTNIHTSFGGNNEFNAGDNVADQLYFADYTTWQFGEAWDMFPFANNTWYTVRLYVGLNSLNSYVEVLGADGTQLFKSKIVDVNRGATTGYTYDTIKFSEFRIDFPAGSTEQEKAALKDLEIGFDDCAVYARKAWPVTVETTGNGTVEYNGNPVTTGSEFAVTPGEDAVFTVTPSEGYKAFAKINGTPCQITDNTVTVGDVDSAKTLTVEFAEKKAYDTVDLSLTPNTVVKVGDTIPLVVNGDLGVTDVTYESSNSDVATVSASGVVSGLKSGITTVTVSSGEVSDSLMIAVSEIDPAEDAQSGDRWTAVDKKRDDVAEQLYMTNRGVGIFYGDGVNALNGKKRNTVSFWYYDGGVNASADYQGDLYGCVCGYNVNSNLANYDGIAPEVKGTLAFYNRRTDDREYAQTSYDINSGNSFGFSKIVTNTVSTGKGWHQMVIRTTDETVAVYVDGKVLAYGTGHQEAEINAVEINGVGCIVDDIVVSYTGDTEIDVENGTAKAKKNITFDIGENGTVAYWKGALSDGDVLSLSEGYDLKLKAIPAEGYVIDTFTVNGEAAEYDADGIAAVTVAADTEIEVTYKESATSNVTVTYDSSKGTVTANGGAVTSGESFIAYESTGLTLSAVAASGFRVSSVKINGTEYEGMPSEIIIDEFVESISVEITFDEKLSGNFTELYVSPEGSDTTGDGSIDAPFASIEMARDTIRGLGGSLPAGGITVNVMSGVYQRAKSIEFTEADSGTEESPITYKAYGGDVSFIGGKELDTKSFKKVDDDKLLERIIDKNARNKIMQIDVASQNVDVTSPESVGWYVSPKTPTTRFYMNGTCLTEARWPNDDESQMLLRAEPYMEGDENGTTYNGTGLPYRFKYPDPENRTNKWQSKVENMYLGGAVLFFWAPTNIVMSSLDTENKILITKDGGAHSAVPGAGWGQQYKIYFANVFEEIDRPGESYYDYDTGILYLYPVGDTEKPEIFVSTLTETLLTVNGASYITIDGIDFKDTRGKLVEINDSDHITLKNSEYTGSSAQRAVEINRSNYITVYGNHFYNMLGAAIKFYDCGDRVNLTSSGNVIENNKFNACCLRPQGGDGDGGKFALIIHKSVGDRVAHNEFVDLQQGAVLTVEANDILIEYNKIMHCSHFGTDNGTIYWGRDVTTLGNKIRYNYFEDIGSAFVEKVLEGGETGSIFIDDGGTAPEVYGNVFYNAGSAPGAIRSNTGEYWDVYNNLFINDDGKSDNYMGITTWHSAAPFNYGPDKKTPSQMWRSIDNFSKHTDIKWLITGDAKSGLYTDERKSYILSPIWKAHYEESNWERFYDLYNETHINATQELAESGDREALMQYLNTKLPDAYKNLVHDNASIGVTTIGLPDRVEDWNNYTTTSGKHLFKNYGTDWTLTDEGLAEIQKVAKDFEEIPFKDMGLLTKVGSTAPEVTVNEAVINGIPAVGNVITPDYTFTDADGDLEANSKILWYVSSKKNGTYNVVEGKADRYFEIPEGFEGMYVKFAVIPYDTYSLRGKRVESEPVQIINNTSVDLTELTNAIKAASALADSAVAGTTNGTYPQDSIDALKKAIEDATAVARNENSLQYDVNNAVKALENAITKFKISENLDLEFMNINKLLESKEGWVDKNGEALGDEFKDGKLVLTQSKIARYTAKKYGNTIFNFNLRFETEGENIPAINTEKDDSPLYAINGGAFKVRGQNTTGEVYEDTTDYGLLAWFKNSVFEIQEYTPTATGKVFSFENDVFTEFNKDYNVSYGAYDTEDGTRVVMYVDGKLVADHTCVDAVNKGLEGFLAFRGCVKDTIKMVISPADVDLTELNAKIAEAEDFVKNAEIGTGYNQYSKEAVDALKAVIAEAKELLENETVAQIPVDRKALELAQAILDVKATSGDKIDVSGKTEIEINYDVPEAEINATKNVPVSIVLEKDELTPEITLTTATDNGKASLQIPAGSELSGKDWDGKITNPVYSETPSATVGGNLSVDAVYTTGGSVVESDGLVRFVFPGAKNKRVYYLNESGKYVEVTKRINEDSYKAAETTIGLNGAAKITVGNDIVVYSSYITEFIICSNVVVDDDNDDANNNVTGTTKPIYGGGGGAGGGGFFSTTTTTPSANATNTFVFSDMTSHWAKADVMSMYNAGIVSGVTANTFEPDRSITRAEFATLIAKGLKLTLETTNDFSDVKADDWFAPYVGAAAKAGIIVGADGKFRPNDTITREEMAVIIVKAYTYLGGKGANGAIDNFSDKADISSWAKAYVDSAASAGLISGMGDGTFGPKESATRAQAASLVYRVIK